MALAARAIPPRLDPQQDDRPWFMLRGSNGIPTTAEHASWDLGDMTGRYLEALILARRMGISEPELSQAEGRLGRYLLKLLGPDGVVHDPQTGAIDHCFSQGSAMYGLLAWFEASGDPTVRTALERLISGQLRRAQRDGDKLIDPTVKLEQSSGSHLAGYQIYPTIRFYELTGYGDARILAEGLTRWALSDPVLGPAGQITKPLSWEGHLHSWLDTLAGCVRTARNCPSLDCTNVVARARATYDWVRRTNASSFGWIATYPTGGSSETCAISSAIRLALELAACGHPEYLNEVERFARNQVIEAQFKDLKAYQAGTHHPSPLLLGCFDSQSMPNGHLGTRGGEDVGTVEGCCLNGGMRALALAWDAIETADEAGLTVNLALSRSGPDCDVIGYQPNAGRVDVIPRRPGPVRIRVPDWVRQGGLSVVVDRRPCEWSVEQQFVRLPFVRAHARVSVEYPLREFEEQVTCGGQSFHVWWKGDMVMRVDPPGQREPAYQRTRPGRASVRASPDSLAYPIWARGDARPPVPDTYTLQDACRLSGMSMLGRMDLQRDGQPFFIIYPFAFPPRAEHGKWDDGDMTGRYVEGLILSRRLTGAAIDPREATLRHYLANLFDASDGLCYTRATAWTPRRACLFSQSSAMLGMLAWYRYTGSPEARRLLDRQADGLMHIAVFRKNYACFPKYEYDGKQYVDEPAGKDAPPWYGGRVILPLVEYWQISQREDVKIFLEKLIRYCTEVSSFIKPDGAVERGEGWWGHLHGTMDMVAGIAEYGRLANRPELVAWAKRVYDWIGRTQTTRYGFVADVSGSGTCESCAIASRIRLGLALYRAGAIDPFGEIDRFVRNQLIENQFNDLSFLPPLKPGTPRTDRATYAGIDRMIRGTFQCWGTANALIGADEIEGCGAGGGTQGIGLAWDAQSEWRETAQGQELRVNLLFNRTIHAAPGAGLTSATPIAAELWSCLPCEGRVTLRVHQPISRLALRLPDGSDSSRVRVWPGPPPGSQSKAHEIRPSMDGQYAVVSNLLAGQEVELQFLLRKYETVERAAGVDYHVRWKGSSVLGLSPAGKRVPLYADRVALRERKAMLSAPRYPR
jgi:hypothetical protein